ncbi:MAG: glycosyltransferase [Chloroflexi bacterium]|nr:glycosyltransferase [Chloroflexota bacterium]
MSAERPLKVLFVSTWQPKPCGIAAYSGDLAAALSLAEPRTDWRVAAINDPGDRFDYSPAVRQQIDKEDLASLRRVAAWINASGADVVSLQHEFGLWGGFDGELILRFLDRLHVPVVATLHTAPLVESTYNRANRLRLLGEIGARIAQATVFLPVVREALIAEVGLPPERVSVAPHGAPVFPPVDRAALRVRLGLDDRLVLTTFGLLNRHRGIEDVLRALPPLVAACPRLLYLVLGRMHPYEPPDYAAGLRALVADLGLTDHVRFEERYIPDQDLRDLLIATDIYLAPYHDLAQAGSGTLMFALSAGCCCVATPFLYARHVLAHERGVLVPPADPVALTAALRLLLADTDRRERYRAGARAYAQELAWPRIGRQYLDLLGRVVGRG